MKRILATFGLAMALVGAGLAAQAHSFNVALVGEAVRESGAYDGFRLATLERDAHAGEESDGHLGGLDVYIFTAEPGAELPADMNIVVLLDAGAFPAVSVQKEIGSDALRPSIAWAALIALDFESRYAATYGTPASPAARQGYYAAQLIERYVRQNPGFINR